MTATRHATVIRVLRGSLALALVLFAALVGLYLFGRQGQPEPAVSTPGTAAGGEDYAVRGEGFEFALTKGDQVVFEIRGREQRSDRSGKVYLEDVLIAMERGDGPYRVKGAKALYDQGTQEARLEGDVVVQGPRGITVETDWLELADEGRRVRARDGVRFASGRDLRGRADRLETDLDRRTFALSGAVEVGSASGARASFRIRTEELVFREESASAVARGGVTLSSGASRITAQRLYVFLDPETRELQRARLLSAVEGVLATSALGAEEADGAEASHPIALRATAVEVRFDPRSGQPREFDLRGLERRPARVVQSQPDGSVANLTLVELRGEFENGVLARADLHGPLWLTQSASSPRRGADRQVKALSGDARFDPADGSLAGVTLVGEVWLRDADALATGNRAYVDLKQDTFEILGAPAHLEHPRGALDAPHAVYGRGTGILRADGGIAAVLVEGGAALAPGLATGAADQPLRVEAREAMWEAEPSTVRFLGQVRAWQGANTIFAEQLRAEPDRGWMAASGGVRTLWAAPPESDDAPAGSGDGGAAAPEPQTAPSPSPPSAPAEATSSAEERHDEERPHGPLEVTAAEMTYSESEGELVYTGAVRAVQDWTTLECERMTVELGPAGEAEEILCEIAVRIVDSRNARTLAGDRAIYYPEVPEVEVFGDPLTMEDAAGNKVEGGRHFVYDLESGHSRLTAKAAEGR